VTREKRMKLQGTQIASRIYENLEKKVSQLQRRGIQPHLSVLLVGKDPASESYVHQKKKKGEQIAATVDVLVFPQSVSERELIVRIKELNRNPKVHGIIVQRPLPSQISEEAVDEAVASEKDIDGFLEESPYQEPISLAVDALLKEALKEIAALPHHKDQISLNVADYANLDDYIRAEYKAWIQQKKIVVIGKGKTGGTPIINYLSSINAAPTVIDSKTVNPSEITRQADIIISTVGKANILTKDMIKKGAILIAIGMYRGNDGKLHGDYEEADIENVAEIYTSVPGGVGPVNVAMLLENLIRAAENANT
jgi:methylenetetrahydrofolate dehydrogenase (NADP+)/methenyltetrahydrofolate cyclohydrolase